jgi:hypothetical protein
MKKLNNKILLMVLLALAAVFALSRVFRAGSREGNARRELVNLDTAAVTEIKISSNTEKNQELRLLREGKNWTVKMGNRSARMEQGIAAGAMNYFVHLKPLRLIAKKKTKWKEFNVADTSTRVKFMKGNEVLADVRIGRIGFNQQPGQQQFNRGGVFTYVRLSDEDEVFAVEGFLEATFNKSYNDWRDKAFLRVKQNEVTRVSFSYPADSGFVVEKRDKKWWINNTEADSMKVNGYLSQLEYKNATTFADDFKARGDAQAAIQVSNGTGTLATVQGWKRADDWAVSTSYQPGIYFTSKGLESVLEGKRHFLPAKKK